MRTIISRTGIYQIALIAITVLALGVLGGRRAEAHANAHHEPYQETNQTYDGCKFMVTLPSSGTALGLYSGDILGESCTIYGYGDSSFPSCTPPSQCLFEFGWNEDTYSLGTSTPYAYSRGWDAQTIQYSALSWGTTYVFRTKLTSTDYAVFEVCNSAETSCSTIRTYYVGWHRGFIRVQGEYDTFSGQNDPYLGLCRQVSNIGLWNATTNNWNAWTIFTMYSVIHSTPYDIMSAGGSFSWGDNC